MKILYRHLQHLYLLLINYAAFSTLMMSPAVSASIGNDAEKTVGAIGGYYKKKESSLLKILHERNLRTVLSKKKKTEKRWKQENNITCTVHVVAYLSNSWVNAGKLNDDGEEDIDKEYVEEIPDTLCCIDYANQHKEYKLTYDGHSNVDILIHSPVFNGTEPTSGETILQVPSKSVLLEKGAKDVGGHVMDLSILSDKIKVLSTSDIGIASRLGKQKRIGDSTVAVFRVISADDEPTKSAVELADDIFGIGGTDNYNLQSGYRWCSGNKLNFYPGQGNGLVNGILEVFLEESTAGRGKDVVERMALKKITSSDMNFPLSNYDHYMYVMPPNVDFDTAAAYACLWCPKTAFWDIHASNYQVILHEIGHNIGHVHSGKNGGSYADRTCWMGSHTYWDEGPAACFNAPKSWYFGWYNNRHAQFVPSAESVSLKLAGIDDYLNDQTIEGEHFVILRLKEGSEDLFIMYNRAEGVNRGVRGSVNKVTVVEQKGDGRRGQSWQLGELGAGDTYTKSDWNGSGKNLAISVCNLVPGTPDHANVVAYVEGETSGTCDDFTFAPTSSPTNTPDNIHVNYYEVSLNALPAEGLKSLVPYANGYVQDINFLPGSGEDFATSGRANNVAALFVGYWKFPIPDEYYICMTSDDGSKLFIEDTLVIDNDRVGNSEKCSTYETSGVRKMTVEYFQKAGGKRLVIEWVPLSRPPEFRLMTVVPPSAFVQEPNESTENPSTSLTSQYPSKGPTAKPPTKSNISPTLNPSIDPSASPTLNSSADTSTLPSLNPSADFTVSPSATLSGNVHVNYYEAFSWTDLPSAGLLSLSPYKSERVDNINYPRTTGTFAGSGRSIHVAALFQGYLKFPFPDKYYLCINSDDGSKLFINNTLVINKGGIHDSEEKCSFYNGTGVSKVEVEYFQRGGHSALFLKWVPMSRPPNFKLMVAISSSDFVHKPNETDTPSDIPSTSLSVAPSEVQQSSSPTSNPCPGLAQKKCSKKNLCIWDPAKTVKLCVPKILHDCTQHTTANSCKKAANEACLFESVQRLCRHRCEGETKKTKCHKIQNKSKKKMICKFRSQKNPCFKCHARSVCGR